MKTLLYIVDVQNDFILPNGKLYVKDAEIRIAAIKKAIEWAKENDIQIVYSADYHYKDSKELSATPDFVNTFPEHCMVSDNGWKLVDGIEPEKPMTLTWTDEYDNVELFDLAAMKDGLIILKDAFDVFEGNRNTNKFFDIVNPDVVYVAGVVSEICVNQAVCGFLKRDISVVVLQDAIQYLDPAKYNDTLNEWKSAGVELITTQDLK